MSRLIFHIDVNSAFLSWESARRVKQGLSDLRDIPACIGGDPKKRTGIVVAKSIPAKKYGITTGEPVAMALRKCPELVIVKSDFELYIKCSRAFKEICASYAPVMESFSIDEVFLDMTGTSLIYPDPIKTAHEIKDKIRDELGFTVNVGISTNKLLAKMASDFEKPDKIHVLTQDMVPQKLWPLPVGNLFGVGPKSVKRMHEIGIYTIGDLANADADILRGVFGVRGQVFRDYANGIESEPMTRSEVKDNSYGNSVTTPQDLKRPVEADATMLALCESVAGRLRMDGKTARVITVQLVDNAFRRRSHQVTLNSPTNSTDVIYHTARELMRQMWPDRPVRLVGVSAEKTGTDNFEQLDFFTDPAKTDKQEKLDRAADALRARFGEGAILRAKLLHPDEKTTAPKALGAAKARDKRKGEL